MLVKILGVPTSLGANCCGSEVGPNAIRYAGLVDNLKELGLEVDDLGNIKVNSMVNQKNESNVLLEISQICEDLSFKTKKIVEDKALPIILGGDHSITIGSLAGVAAEKEIGLIWFDAHGDLNTHETSPSGNIHGMPLASSLGNGAKQLVQCGKVSPKVKEENVVLIGIRDLDREEKRLLKSSQMTVFTMNDIDRLGIYQVMKQAIEISNKDVDGVHISFDMDVLDPTLAPGVGTPVAGGLNYREAHLAMEMIAEANILTSLDIVEVNPILDQANQTGEMAVDLIRSALGKIIL